MNAGGSPVAPGSVLGSYRIERLLGRGGMGTVFLARDTTLQRLVALKVLEGSTAGPRVLREARNAAALNHPNICTIHEVDDSGGAPFIAMEFADGQSLRDRLEAGPLEERVAVQYGAQAADALAYAHAHGVVHRDFKAANIIVTTEGRVKVVDFGLAQRDDALMAGAVTTAGTMPVGVVAGTPYTMAPEQVRGEIADARTDIWALGVLLYEMVSGQAPFNGATVPELFSAILTSAPAPLPASVSVGLRAIIDRCLEKDPARRFERTEEIRAALEEVLAGTASPWSAWRYRLRRHRWLAPVAGAVAAVGMIVALNVGGVRDRVVSVFAPPPIRLAVLPFENRTGDPGQEYFSDGLTDETIAQLGRLHPRRLSVIARTSSMQYKNRRMSVADIGRELGVDYVLEGSARREGSRVRVSVTLIDVRDQSTRWANTFDREVSGLLSVQNDVSRGVSEALALGLLAEQQERLAIAHPVNPEAYEAYLRGRSSLERLGRPDLDAALRHFELAIAKDPAYAPAYVGVASVWGTRFQLGAAPAAVAQPAQSAALVKARQLDETLPEVHLGLAGFATWSKWDWAGAEPHFQRALDPIPTSPKPARSTRST